MTAQTTPHRFIRPDGTFIFCLSIIPEMNYGAIIEHPFGAWFYGLFKSFGGNLPMTLNTYQNLFRDRAAKA